MTELVIPLLIGMAAAAATVASLAYRRRRRATRQIERLYVERHPLSLTYAEVDRALDGPPEPATSAPRRPLVRIDSPVAIAGLTVVAVVAVLLLVRPHQASTNGPQAPQDVPRLPAETTSDRPAAPAVDVAQRPTVDRSDLARTSTNRDDRARDAGESTSDGAKNHDADDGSVDVTATTTTTRTPPPDTDDSPRPEETPTDAPADPDDTDQAEQPDKQPDGPAGDTPEGVRPDGSRVGEFDSLAAPRSLTWLLADLLAELADVGD